MKKNKTYTAQHRGILKECLETEKVITENIAKRLIDAGIYKYYAYDERINADRYILIEFDKNLGLPAWLHIYKG